MLTHSTRRQFACSSLASLLATLATGQAAAPRRIVLRSSWQTVNIGDIGHTPGVLALLEKQLPGVEVRLWPSKIDNGVEAMLLKRFPGLKIIKTSEDISSAMSECDFLLHGSGPSLVAMKDVARWHSETGKPFGVFGITFSGDAKAIELLSAARFVFFRDSVSLAYAKAHGCTCPQMAFGPDGAFSVDLADDAKAQAYLQAHDLQPGQFLCCLGHLRNTPYWTLPEKKATRDPAKHARNEALKEHDHAPLRAAIIAITRQTSMKILLCPEDKTQIAVTKELLLDPLPDDVKAKVVWRDTYWLTDEALSVYRQSAGVFGNEMHSPIMALGNGIPAIVCRWAEQTSKGIMWRDIGLGDWLFDHDQDEPAKHLPAAALALAQDPAKAKAKALQARDTVRQHQAAMIEALGRV
jgi:Polysaccharide pyruvyl transferase